MANTAMEEWKKKWSNYTQNSGAQSAPAAADPSQKNSLQWMNGSVSRKNG